ncbi:MAG: N-glycosylase/DNA lyase [Armatimonadota bacterium]
MQEIQNIYKKIKKDIKIRLMEFKNIWEEGSEEDIFTELVFCLLTPQSRAKSCWAAVQRLAGKNLLKNGTNTQIEKELAGVRFHHNKARYIVEARKIFLANGGFAVREKIDHKNICNAREWLVKNVKGLGYKEASHFLRNVGFGKEIAILDRHILKNLKKYGAVKDVPPTLTKNNYCAIENRMKAFTKKVNIPLDHLDFILWYKEAGEVFK